MGIGFGLSISQQEAQVVLKFIQVDGLLNEDGAAHCQQIIRAGLGRDVGLNPASAFRFDPCEYSKIVLPWNALKMRVNQCQWGYPTVFG